MGKTIDLTGKTFGRLRVVGRHSQKSNAGALWSCVCQCGNESFVNSLKLRMGTTKSCGCLRDEKIAAVNRTHGMANKTQTYKTWKEMWQRCSNPENDKWHWYGGRGISVCDRWRSFENFLADMGERPLGLTLDRKDNDKGYSKDNCRWLIQLEQTRRQEKNKLKDGVAELVRADRAAGMSYRALGAKYGVSSTTAHRCCVHRTWG